METLQKDPTFVATMSSAQEMYEDPSKAQRIMQQIKDDAVAAGVSKDSLQPVRFTQ